MRVATEVAEFATPSRIVALLRSLAGIGASLGAVHSLAGATTRDKLVSIEGDAAALAARLAQLCGDARRGAKS